MDHACIASYVKCTWKSKCLVKSCCFLVNRSNSCSFHMLCNLSFSIHWRCSPPEISHEKSRGPKKNQTPVDSKRKWPPQKGSQKAIGVFQDLASTVHGHREMEICQVQKVHPTISPYEGIVHPKKPCRHAHLRKTPGICLVSVPPVFLLVHFAACLKGNTGHNTELVPCQKEKSPSAKNAFVLLDELAINHGNSSYPKLSPTRK